MLLGRRAEWPHGQGRSMNGLLTLGAEKQGKTEVTAADARVYL